MARPFLLFLLAWYSHARCIDNLIASWSMDEMGGTKITDRIGRRPLNVPAGYVFDADGNPQGLSSLHARPDNGLIESVPSFPRPAASTVTGWFRSTNASEMAIYSWRDSTYNMVLRILAGRLGFSLNSNAFATNKVLTRDAYNDDRWHFFAATMSDEQGTGTLYVDTHTNPSQVPLVWSLGNAKQHNIFQIGGLMQDWGSMNYDGYLDDIRVYSTILSKENVILISMRGDTPCSPEATLSSLTPTPLSIRANSNLNIVVDLTNSAICQDGGGGLCTSDRYAVALSICTGSIAGVAFLTGRDGVALGTGKNVLTNISACAGAYDGTKYVSDADAKLSRLCSAQTPAFGVRGTTSPIGMTDSFGSLVVASGVYPVTLEAAVVVGNSKGESPVVSSFSPVNANFSCTNNKLQNATWAMPTLTEGTLCSRCTYQAWYIPTRRVYQEQVNPRSICGLRLFGQALPNSFTATSFQDFVLPATAQEREYIWAIVATNIDGFRAVITVFDACKVRPNSFVPATTPSPTPGAHTSSNGVIANSLKLDLDWTQYPPGPAREGFQMRFLNNVSRLLEASMARFTATTIQGGYVGFNIRDPLPGEFDLRTAEELTDLVYEMHLNRSSALYTFLPDADPNPDSFQSSSHYIQLQQRLAAGGQRSVEEPSMSVASKLALGLGICGGVLWCCFIVGRVIRVKRQAAEQRDNDDAVHWHGPSDRVIAVHAYREDQADPKQDLLFEPGTVIQVVSRECDDGPGWLIGQLNGRTGMVPKAYVRDYFGR